MKKSRVILATKEDNTTVYAVETTTSTYIADGVYHHNCSMRCNKMRSGEYVKYKAELKFKYGDEVPAKLEAMAEEFPARTHHFTKEELLKIVHDAQSQVKLYEDKADGKN